MEKDSRGNCEDAGNQAQSPHRGDTLGLGRGWCAERGGIDPPGWGWGQGW